MVDEVPMQKQVGASASRAARRVVLLALLACPALGACIDMEFDGSSNGRWLPPDSLQIDGPFGVFAPPSPYPIEADPMNDAGISEPASPDDQLERPDAADAGSGSNAGVDAGIEGPSDAGSAATDASAGDAGDAPDPG